MKKLFLIILFFSFFLSCDFSNSSHNNRKLINLPENDTMRKYYVNNIHNINSKEVSKIILKTTFENPSKEVEVITTEDINLICSYLNIIVDTARTDTQYEPLRRLEVQIIKFDSSDLKFVLHNSKLNGVFTTFFSEGWQGWVYGGYRIDDNAQMIFEKLIPPAGASL